MRSFLFAGKIAIVFLVVLGVFVVVTLHLFSSLVLGADDMWAAHRIFVVRVVQVFGVAVVTVVAFCGYLTSPLRRMRRSMDRIAAGDLAHRVPARGRDEVAQMGRSFNRMADRVEEMISRRKELVASVSHELRSPLTRAKVSLELLRESGADPDRVRSVESDLTELDDLVDELLLAGRAEGGRGPGETERVRFDELCRQAWIRVEARASERGIPLHLEGGAESVVVDRALTLRLLGNLFENSVRHAESGAVTVRYRAEAGRLAVVVLDDGPGVADGDLDRLFEPFFRADASRSRKTGAAGMGLAIVKRAVLAHGGNVRATNGDRGLEIAFDLPLYPCLA